MHSDNQNSNLVVLKAKEPKSPESFIELLKGHIDLATRERLSYICIKYKIDGEIYSASVSLTYPD